MPEQPRKINYRPPGAQEVMSVGKAQTITKHKHYEGQTRGSMLAGNTVNNDVTTTVQGAEDTLENLPYV